MAHAHVVAIGKRIRARRKELHMTQHSLAEKLPGSTDGNQVSRWERGVHKPSHGTLEHIAAALDVEVGALLMDAPSEPTPDPFVEDRLARVERKLDDITSKIERVLVDRDDEVDDPELEAIITEAEDLADTLHADAPPNGDTSEPDDRSAPTPRRAPGA